jgi:hypothetical protein
MCFSTSDDVLCEDCERSSTGGAFITVEARSQRAAEVLMGTEEEHDEKAGGLLSIDTRAVHAGYNPAEFVVRGSVAPPLYMANTYERSCQNVSGRFSFTM